MSGNALLPPCIPAAASAREVGSLAVAVGAQEPKIVDPIIEEVAVDVINIQAQRLSLPGAVDAANCASVLDS
ncbi:MAG TPA: hypothetical protein VJ782_02050 [Aeromicrobium sp.]|nr:hypothetical protein [Aeromicrobium sp.]